MRLLLLSDNAVRFEPTPGPLHIESLSPDQPFSPFHMVAGGLAYCTFSVMATWAETAGLTYDDLTLEVEWTFADDPHRVGTYDVRFHWPSLPENRRTAAERVAEQCTIHATFKHPPEIRTSHTTEAPSDGEREQADGAEPAATVS